MASETLLAPVTAETRTHHKYGPSKMNYLAECAAFTSRSGDVNEAAEQGTFLHELMELMLKEVIAGRQPLCLPQVKGWVTKMNELTDEEVSYLEFCCKRCDAFISKKPTKIVTEIEVCVYYRDGHYMLNHGFLDVLFIFPTSNGQTTGIIQDFKFGWNPVPAADKNLQGINYAVGIFQSYPELTRIGVEFVQPKLNWTTSKLFTRADSDALLASLVKVITQAEFVQTNPAEAQQFMRPGAYCDYCALNGTCAVLLNHRAVMAAKLNQLPAPPSFLAVEISKPEDLALARYWVDVMEAGIEELKKRAFEVATINNGSISCTLPSGEVVTYEIKERASDRSLGSAIEIAEAFKEFATPEEILGAADLAIGKLEAIVVASIVEVAKAGGEKMTKKAAKEQMMSTLEATGLVTQSDFKVKFLKRVKATPEPAKVAAQTETKQIEQPKTV